MKEDDIKLTPEQEQYIADNWDKMSLSELAQKISGDDTVDGRSVWGRVIRKWLSERKLEYTTSRTLKGNPIELTDDHKKFIDENKESVKPLELARILFDNSTLTPLSNEFKAVYAYCTSIGSVKRQDKRVEGEYKQPKSLNRLIPKVNKSVTKDFAEDKVYFDEKSLKPAHEKWLKALLGYMNNYRYIFEINRFEYEVDQELFESSFIRYTYNKPDLLEEEVDQYIELCVATVNTAQIHSHIQLLDKMMKEHLEGSEEEKKMSMTFVELIDKARAKYTDSYKRVDSLRKSLNDSRATRLKNKDGSNISIMHLIEKFQNEKKRKDMLEYAKFEKLKEREEVDRIASLPDFAALVMGMSREEGYH